MVHGKAPRFLHSFAMLVASQAFCCVTASASPPSHCAAPEPSEESQVLRIRADEARNRIWILGTDGLYLYQRSESAARRFRLPGWMHLVRSFACPPDITVEEGGAVIVSSNVVPNLWRVDPETSSVAERPVHLGAAENRDIGFSSLEVTHRGTLRAHSASDDSRWEIDLRSGRAVPLEASRHQVMGNRAP